MNWYGLLCFILPISVAIGVLITFIRIVQKRFPNELMPLGHFVLGIGIALFFGFLTLVGMLIIAIKIDPYLNMPEVQAALDEQCGKNKYLAQPDGYSNDLFPYWSDGTVTCANGEGTGWECRCPTPTPVNP